LDAAIAAISGQVIGAPPFSGVIQTLVQERQRLVQRPGRAFEDLIDESDVTLGGPPGEHLGVGALHQGGDVDRPEHLLRVGELAQQDLPQPSTLDPGGELAGQRRLGRPWRAQDQRVLARQHRGHQRPHNVGALQELPGQLIGDRGQPLGGARGGRCVLSDGHPLLLSKVAFHFL
jgi:hypothetical protein